MPESNVLLIEDDELVRSAAIQTLEIAGFKVQVFTNAEDAAPWVDASFNGIIVTDVRLPGMSGVDFLRKVIGIDYEIPVILITGHGDIGMAVDAMRAGAYDFIAKPFGAEQLISTARHAHEKRSLVLENRQLREAHLGGQDAPSMVGQSAAIDRIRQLIRVLGSTQVDILINGDTGTGKEVVARQLHLASKRKGPFVAINCGALPESMFESEIFGHEAGSFTSAQKRRIGKIEFARDGTVFLDEIESMPMALQVKLLRVLQERQLERLGGNELIDVNCRVVAASKADLLQLSQEGRFREDLYYRLSVVSIDLPRLKDRQEDIPLLLTHFLQLAALRYDCKVPTVSDSQLHECLMRSWPGNVRELRNFADRLALGIEQLGGTAVAERPTLSVDPAAAGDDSLTDQVSAFERHVIAKALAECNGNVQQAAERLALPKKTLYDKIKKYQLPTSRTKE